MAMTQKFRFNNNECQLSFTYRVTEGWEDSVLYFGFNNSVLVRVRFDKEAKMLRLSSPIDIPKCLEDELDYNGAKTLESIKPRKDILERLCRE